MTVTRLPTSFWFSGLGSSRYNTLMLAAVDLNELAKTGSPRTRLLDGLAQRPRYPQSGLSHPAAQRLAPHIQPVTLQKLLPGQCGAEVGVKFTNQGQHVLPKHMRKPVIARLAAFAGDDAVRALLTIAAHQELHLPIAQTQTIGRRALGGTGSRMRWICSYRSSSRLFMLMRCHVEPRASRPPVLARSRRMTHAGCSRSAAQAVHPAGCCSVDYNALR